MTPPGSISTICFEGFTKKKLTRGVRSLEKGHIYLLECVMHYDEMPSLPVVVKRYSPAGIYLPDSYERVCVLCWSYFWPREFDDKPVGDVWQVTSKKTGRQTTRVRIGSVRKVIRPYTGPSRHPYLITWVDFCEKHPDVSLPVSLLSAEYSPDDRPTWFWTEDARCCPFCWFIHSRTPVDPVPWKEPES